MSKTEKEKFAEKERKRIQRIVARRIKNSKDLKNDRQARRVVEPID